MTEEVVTARDSDNIVFPVTVIDPLVISNSNEGSSNPKTNVSTPATSLMSSTAVSVMIISDSVYQLLGKGPQILSPPGLWRSLLDTLPIMGK